MLRADSSQLSPDSQFVDLFERSSAAAADDSAAITAHQGIGYFLLTVGAVEGFTFRRFSFWHFAPVRFCRIYTSSTAVPRLFLGLEGLRQQSEQERAQSRLQFIEFSSKEVVRTLHPVETFGFRQRGEKRYDLIARSEWVLGSLDD